MKDLEMKGPDLVKEYNSLAAMLDRDKVKKFRTLAEGHKRLAKIREEAAKANGKKKAALVLEEKITVNDAYAKIVLTKVESKKHTTETEMRFLELMRLEDKTVKNYLDKIGKKGSGDIKYWAKEGRIKLG